MNEVATTNNQVAVSEDFNEIANKYLSTCGQRIPQNKATEFIQIAKAMKLDPFKREVYLVQYKDSCNILVGYEVYIKRAERTGKVDGWNVTINGNPNIDDKGKYHSSDCSATITIYRKDWHYPFTHTVYLDECIQTKYTGEVNSMWKSKTRLMLKKVAISQGFRLCFPDELGGLPYAEEEMPKDEEIENEIRNVTPPAENIAAAEPEAEKKAEVKPAEKNEDIVVENPVVKDEPQASNEVINACKNLEYWLENYSAELNVSTKNGNPYILAKETLSTGSDSEILTMCDRIRKVLVFKGVRV